MDAYLREAQNRNKNRAKSHSLISFEFVLWAAFENIRIANRVHQLRVREKCRRGADEGYAPRGLEHYR